MGAEVDDIGGGGINVVPRRENTSTLAVCSGTGLAKGAGEGVGEGVDEGVIGLVEAET